MLWRTSPKCARKTDDSKPVAIHIWNFSVFLSSRWRSKGKEKRHLLQVQGSAWLILTSPSLADIAIFDILWLIEVYPILDDYDQPQEYKESFLNFQFLIQVSKTSISHFHRKQKKLEGGGGEERRWEEGGGKTKRQLLSLNPGLIIYFYHQLSKQYLRGLLYN